MFLCSALIFLKNTGLPQRVCLNLSLDLFKCQFCYPISCFRAPIVHCLCVFLFLGLWMAQSTMQTVLALNRCLFFSCPRLENSLFGSDQQKTGWRTWFWTAPSCMWGFCYFVWGTPGVFSSLLRMEVFNPHFGYANDMAKYVCLFLSFFLKCKSS